MVGSTHKQDETPTSKMPQFLLIEYVSIILYIITENLVKRFYNLSAWDDSIALLGTSTNLIASS